MLYILEDGKACGKPITKSSLYKEMTSEQRKKYKELLQRDKNSLMCLKWGDEKICHKNSTYNFLYCKKCNIGSCTVCYEEFKTFKNGVMLDVKEQKELLKSGMYYHQRCYFYKVMKDDWDKAKIEGLTRKCPGWGFRGTK